MAECQLPKLDGAGSTPVSRSKNSNPFQDNSKYNQGQKVDKTLPTSGTEQSSNPALNTSHGQPESFDAQIKNRNFSITRGSDLAEVVESWPGLSGEVRRRILDIVKAAKGGES